MVPNPPESAQSISSLLPAGRESRLSKSGWEALLLLARRIKAFPGFPKYCLLRLGGRPAVSIDSPLAPAPHSYLVAVTLDPRTRLPVDTAKNSDASVRVKGLVEAVFRPNPRLPQELLLLLKLYLPFCFLSLHARRLKRALSLSHFAQSLDGWVATISGDSRWIGGPGNLVHAHRMRALLDAVLVGSRTLNLDRPQLTVRHVKGDNPVRIVLGKNLAGLESLLRSSRDPVILIGGQAPPGEPCCLALSLRSKNGFVPTGRILKELYKRGIHSVYIEGGAITASRFLQENRLDIIQVHIAPLILGPGLTGFLLPPAQKISQALRFGAFSYTPVDDGVMFTGVPRPAKDEA
jgi:diaminohydroxyphosphoribosylaminopyrimidine deaminase/5-amino-6-(5-phosphoribosylamino)uracil reductase